MASTINASSSGAGGLISTGDSSGVLQIQTNTSTTATFDASGNVGIGTTTPSQKLHVYRNTATTDAQIQSEQAGAGEATVGFLKTGVYAWLTGISTDYSYRIAGSGSSLATNTRFMIDTSGNVLVGTASANGILTVSSSASNNVAASIANTSASPYGLLTDFTSDPNNATNYGYKFRLTNNTNIYTIFSNGTTSARSDERFKKDIETTRDGYAEDLSKLRVVKYRWHNAEDNSPKELGFIAQEVEQVFPNLISTEINDDGIDVKSIKTSVFVPMLVKAIQEQQEIIKQLQADVAELKGAK